MFACAGARAEVLPWLLGVEDPWNSGRKVEAYGKKLRPSQCPPLPQAGQKLGMNDVVITILCHGTASRTAYLSLLSQADSYVSGYSAYLPTVGALAATSSYATTSAGLSPDRVTAISTRTTPTLNASLLLYDFGQREARLETAELSLIAAGYSYDSGLQSTIASALSSYYGLLSSQKAVAVAKESLRVAAETFNAAQIRYDLGLVSLTDKLQASVSNSNAELGLQQAENSLSQSRAALSLQMGLPPDMEYEVTDTDDLSLSVDPFGGKIKELMETAKEKRVDLEASRKSLEAAKISQRYSKRANRATISATTNIGFDDWDAANGDTTRSQNIGVTISIPLFNGFVDTYNERITQRGIESQEIQLKQSELAIEQDVFVAWQNYQTAKESWEINKEQLIVATRLQDIERERYKEGLSNIISVLSAQTSYTSALQSNLSARNSLLLSRLSLVRAVGVLNLETMDPETTADGSPPQAALPPEEATTPAILQLWEDETQPQQSLPPETPPATIENPATDSASP
jgi:outer membrane protein TolC